MVPLHFALDLSDAPPVVCGTECTERLFDLFHVRSPSKRAGAGFPVLPSQRPRVLEMLRKTDDKHENGADQAEQFSNPGLTILKG